jgi:hypothetical protein
MMKIIMIIFFAVFLMGCSTDDSLLEINPNNENEDTVGHWQGDTLEYVEGEIGFGLKDSVTLIELANYIYSLEDIYVNEVVLFQYYTRLPQDSMQIIKSVLESKSYIWDGMVYVSYIEADSSILIEFWIKDFKSGDRQNWIATKERFELIHVPYDFQLGLLKVEIGKEKEWIDKLIQVNLFRFVELNYITHTC